MEGGNPTSLLKGNITNNEDIIWGGSSAVKRRLPLVISNLSVGPFCLGFQSLSKSESGQHRDSQYSGWHVGGKISPISIGLNFQGIMDSSE